MPTDLQDPALSTQTNDGTVNPNAGSSLPGAQDGAQSTTVQPPQEGNRDGEIGPQNLPPELEDTRKQLMRDYHSKMQQIKEDRIRYEREMEKLKGESSTLSQLMQQEWFRKAAEAERGRRSGQVTEVSLSDEEFQQATTDKGAFVKLVSKMAEQIASAKVGAAEAGLGQTQQTLQELKAEREYEAVANNPRYKDFRTLNEQGSLDPYLEKGLDFESAYKAYKFDHPERPAAPPLSDTDRRNGSVSPGGQPLPSNGQRIIKAKSLDEAFDAAWDEIQRGNKNFKLERA